MHFTIRRLFLAVAAGVAVFLTGCAGPSPNYAPSIPNVEALKSMGAAPAKVGVIAVTPGMQGATSLSVRANTMVSSVGSNYGDYLAAALRQELELAKLASPQSNIEITGTLLRNNIDAGGFSVGDGQMEARFVVAAGQTVRFDKVKRVTHQWESSFVGATAIPAAANAYPVMVQKLISALVTDPDFAKALKN